MEICRFVIPGIAQAQGRPRAGKTFTGRTVVYDPSKSRDYKQYVRIVASQNRPEKPYEGQIKMQIDVYRPIPKSMPKYKQKLAVEGQLRPVTKPDIDNYFKSVSDALNGVIYKDDSQIIEIKASKFYSDAPRVEVVVYELKVPKRSN